MTDIVPAWKWRPPDEIIERLIDDSARVAERSAARLAQSSQHPQRDRFYTQARRLHIQQVMKGRR